MYEMYPDSWPIDDRQPPVAAKPRRRARKAHSVVPVVLGDAAARKPRAA